MLILLVDEGLYKMLFTQFCLFQPSRQFSPFLSLTGKFYSGIF